MPSPLAPLPALALLLGAGALAHWLAWRMRLPAILLLLLTGFVAGPVTGLLDPDRMFGEAFRPLVSLAVGLILFEGGLTLRFDELRGAGKVVRNLVTVGMLVTWALSTWIGVHVAGVSFDIALLVGAILVLTGPTVVIPLVRHVRPRAPLGPVLRWEGILIDPIGALLAVLVLEALTSGSDATTTEIVGGILRTLTFGGGLGLLAGLGLAKAFERFLVPDSLHVPVTFGAVAVAFVIANQLQAEAGLLTVTVMGIVLANRRTVDIAHIAEWKEQMSTILLSILFISIAARLPLEQLTALGWRGPLYCALLVLVVRPVAVLVSTLRSGMPWPDRAFLMAMAPRGIVVAAVSSEFSLHYEHHGLAGGDTIVALVFPVIVLSVLIYGLCAKPIARLLGVAQGNPQGVLIVGADRLGREVGAALQERGFAVLLVDTNARNAATARTQGLPTWHGSVLSTRFLEQAGLDGLGKVLALLPSDEVNRLALEEFLPLFGRAGLYRIGNVPKGKGKSDREPVGRVLFNTEHTLDSLDERLRRGARIKSTRLTEHFGPEQFLARDPSRTLPLFVITPENKLQVVAEDDKAQLKIGSTVLSLVSPGKDDAPIEAPTATPAQALPQPPGDAPPAPIPSS